MAIDHPSLSLRILTNIMKVEEKTRLSSMPCLQQDECHRRSQKGYVISRLSRFELNGISLLVRFGASNLPTYPYHHQGAGPPHGTGQACGEACLQQVLRLGREIGGTKEHSFRVRSNTRNLKKFITKFGRETLEIVIFKLKLLNFAPGRQLEVPFQFRVP